MQSTQGVIQVLGNGKVMLDLDSLIADVDDLMKDRVAPMYKTRLQVSFPIAVHSRSCGI